ncbi:class I adenylate-forming enzyme family protein [Burkholderia ubonensis]|uniref:class I adenylate-forming enzyme family protein n=1 Tax=Burkholderia ubonensis TaxID=101571 RepID=UPI002ABE8BAD|nr:class I adenylate-forming enzyme family protein [Burkholderia ubonensis]
MKPFHEYISRHAEHTPDKEAVVVCNQRATYGRLERNASAIAEVLRSSGVTRHERVVIYAKTSVEVIAAAIGILKTESVLVLAHYGFGADKLIHQLTEVDARTLIVSAEEDLAPIMGKTSLARIVRIGNSASFPVATVEHLAPSSGSPSSVNQGLEDGEVRAIFYTSGSTASSKGVAVSNRNMVAAWQSVSAYLGDFDNEVILNYSPLHFDYGFYNIMMPLLAGGTSVTEAALPPEPEAMLAFIRREGITGLHVIPTALFHLLQARQEAFPKNEAIALRYIASSGQLLPPARIQRLRLLLPHVDIFSMYGLTECKRVTYLPPEEIDHRPQSVGKAIPGVRVFLATPEGTLIDQPGQTGELAVAGDLVMQGYWGKPELTKKIIVENLFGEDRVLFTGDLFKMDSDGFLYYAGRKDDVFSRRTFQVNPRDVEDVILTHDAVSEAIVIPVADEAVGHVPKACVVLRNGYTVSGDDLIQHCAERLDWYLVPAIIDFYDALPRTVNGKTSRSAVKAEQARSRL